MQIDSLIGPFLPSIQVSALGGAFRRYEADFVRQDQKQWDTCQGRWSCINYYDRAMIYYVWWRRTGSLRYRERANQIALNFRRNYLEGNDYVPAHHWAMMDGVALHYLVTGDTASLTAVGKVADFFAWTVRSERNAAYIGHGSGTGDNRIQAYAIKSLLLAYRLNAPSEGVRPRGIGGGNDWAAMLRMALEKTLASRDEDGQWRLARCAKNTFRTEHPFVIGLLYDSLIRYYTLFEADPRIPEAIKKSVDIMWRDDWVPARKAFKYVGRDCPGEGSAKSQNTDLNNLIVNGFAWTYRMTGDPHYRQHADAIFAGAVNGGSASVSAKHFNQIYTSSYRYLAWR